jgi:hypothetical protein
VSRAVFAAALLLFARGAFAADPSVRATSSVDRTAMWIADRVTYTIDIACERGVDILLDDLAKEKLRVNGLEIVATDASAATDAAERTTHRLRYVMTTYRVDVPGLSIEPIAVRYYVRRPGQRLQDMAPAGEVTVPGAAIAFRSTLPDNQPLYALRDSRPAAPRLPFFVRAQSFGVAMVIVSLAPALFVLASLLRRRAVRTPGRRSARQIQKEKRETLERLRALDVATEADRRRAYDEISAAVRDHVAVSSGVPASALTAAELDAALEGARGRAPRETIAALLAGSDAARYGPPSLVPSAQECRDALAAAEQVLTGR